jgi:rare lipoprotein A
MIKKTWRCLLSALVAFIPLIPSAVSVQADNLTSKENSENSKGSESPTRTSPNYLSSTLKVGETRSQSLARPQGEAIARIHPHQIGNKSAATVYIRNIPVFTFVGLVKVNVPKINTDLKFPKPNDPSDVKSQILSSSDPVERATATVALLNQLPRDGFDAAGIVAVWQADSYLVKFGDKLNLKLDNSLVLPDATQNKAIDALETANLLRRLIGNAQPLASVIGIPMPKPVVKPIYKLPVVSQIISGMASWYGPGFHGGTTANGERFNQYTLTAAHPSLPFGTPVRVTNTDNGRSVIVRINDRGPYAGGRVIDLSKGAAQVLGLISSGVAPVRLEVMGR